MSCRDTQHHQFFCFPPETSFLYKVSLFEDMKSPQHLSVQQPPVLCDLHLQPGLDVQQHLVLVSLALQVVPQLGQLLLHGQHLPLVPGQHAAVSAVGFGERSLQRRFLTGRKKPCEKTILLNPHDELKIETHHAELRLELDLQTLESTFDLCDLGAR